MEKRHEIKGVESIRNILLATGLTIFTISMGFGQSTKVDSILTMISEHEAAIEKLRTELKSLTAQSPKIVTPGRFHAHMTAEDNVYANNNRMSALTKLPLGAPFTITDYDKEEALFRVEFDSGETGYLNHFSVGIDSVHNLYVYEVIDHYNEINEEKRLQEFRNAMNDAKESQHPIRFKEIKVDDISSAGGVDFSVYWYYLGAKTIKYIYFTVLPYNAVGDVVKCSARAYSTFTGKITGPINSRHSVRSNFWETAWYNNTVSCIKLTKVRVEYTDGTSYTYIRELPKLYFPGVFENDCSVK